MWPPKWLSWTGVRTHPAVSLEHGKLSFSYKGTTYEIIPYKDIAAGLHHMADPSLVVCGRDCLYKLIQALNLLSLLPLGDDCFSKYDWLLPEKVLEVLKPFLKENTPKTLQSDNGGEFTNAHMKELLEGLNVKHITSLPYKPSYGMCACKSP